MLGDIPILLLWLFCNFSGLSSGSLQSCVDLVCFARNLSADIFFRDYGYAHQFRFYYAGSIIHNPFVSKLQAYGINCAIETVC